MERRDLGWCQEVEKKIADKNSCTQKGDTNREQPSGKHLQLPRPPQDHLRFVGSGVKGSKEGGSREVS